MMLVLVAAALAQPGAARPAGRVPPPAIIAGQSNDARLLKKLTPAGKRSFEAYIKTEPALLVADLPRIAEADRAVREASQRRPVDVNKLAAATKARNALQISIRRSQTHGAQDFLATLSPADRPVVLGLMGGQRFLSPGLPAPRN